MCTLTLSYDDDYDDYAKGLGSAASFPPVKEAECANYVGYNDKWRIHCNFDKTGFRTATRTGFKNEQMRFLRNIDSKDVELTHCPVPRHQYTYAKCNNGDSGEGTINYQDGPWCSRVVDDTTHDIICDGENK